MSWFWYKSRSKAEKSIGDWNAPLPDMAAQEENRLAALYAWERRLRGYDLFAETIALEPYFVPYDPGLDEYGGGWDCVPQPRDDRADDRPLLFFSLRLPVEQKVTPAQTQEFFSALRGLRSPLSLELIADARSIRYQIACAKEDGAAIAGAIAHCFPLARIEGVAREGAAKSNQADKSQTASDDLLRALTPLAKLPVAHRVVDFGLCHPAYHPLRLFETFSADPHGTIIGTLGSLKAGEVAGVQMLVEPAQSGWGHALALLVQQFAGVTQPAHPNTRDNGLERSLRYKLASPLWAVAVRVFGFTAGENRHPDGTVLPNSILSERAFDLCRRVGATLAAFEGGESSQNGGSLLGNQLVALDDAGYESQGRLHDLLDRRSRRSGMLLSQMELAGLWHPPSERIVHPRLVRYDPRRRDLPDYLKDVPGAALGVLVPDGNGFPGEEQHDGNPQFRGSQIVRWPDAMRNRHLYMLGATRMGKSTLLLNLIAQDMLEGRGLCLIDPHGDLALDVLRRVPPGREDDVFYLDLSDTTHPPAIGLLQAEGEWEKRLLVSDLLAILHRLFQASWGDRLEHILRHALLTLLAAESSPYGTPQEAKPLTLRDIRPLLASKEYRQRLLERVPDPDLHTFWASEFPGYTASAFAPVYNKLGLLLSSPVVRNIIGGSQTKLHAGPLMRDGQILLVNLAQSLIGEDNAHFLGALLVSKIQLAAMHNLRLGREERQPFTLYVDEFQNFVVSSFEKILSEAGKAGLTLVMANQFLEQLGEGLPTAIRSNTGTLISFRVSAQSGRALEGEFGGLFGAKELTDLERGQAVARLGRSANSFLIHTFPPLEPATLGADPASADYIRQRTHTTLCRARGEVEAELRANDESLRRLLEEAALAEKAAKETRRVKPGAAKSETAKAGVAKTTAKSARPADGKIDDSEKGCEAVGDDFTDAEQPGPEESDGGNQPLGDVLEPPVRSRRVRGRAISPRKTVTSSGDRGRPDDRATDILKPEVDLTTPVVAAGEAYVGQAYASSGAGPTSAEIAAPKPDAQPQETPAPAGQLLFFGLPEEPSEQSPGGETEKESSGGEDNGLPPSHAPSDERTEQ